MTTPVAPAAPAPEKAKKVKKESKSKSIQLTDASGARLKFSARKNEDGTATTSAKHVSKDADGTKTTKRYGTESHASFDAAKARIAALGKEYESKGWTAPKRSGVAVAKKDDGTLAEIPAAKSVAAAPKAGAKK